MLPQFSVITPATDITLLTPEEQRVAAGLDRTDTSQDETLAEHEAEVAAEIASDCCIVSDGINPPTLRSEDCADVFRLRCSTPALYLSRHHISAIASINEDGVALVSTDWRLDAEIGKLTRLNSDADTCWSAKRVDIAYTAGFDVVPNDLKAEAKSRMKFKASEASRDPLARRVRTEIPDIELREVDYQVGGILRLTGNDLAPESERRLRRFMKQSMAG